MQCSRCGKQKKLKIVWAQGQVILCQKCIEDLSVRCQAESNNGSRCSNNTVDKSSLCESHFRSGFEAKVWETCPVCGYSKLPDKGCVTCQARKEMKDKINRRVEEEKKRRFF